MDTGTDRKIMINFVQRKQHIKKVIFSQIDAHNKLMLCGNLWQFPQYAGYTG